MPIKYRNIRTSSIMYCLEKKPMEKGALLFEIKAHWACFLGFTVSRRLRDPHFRPGGGVLPYSLGEGVTLGSRKSYPLLDQIL